MDSDDLLLYYRAEELAQSGQMQASYMLFRQLHDKGLQDVNILVGLAYTTADPLEAASAIATIKQMEPNHPQLASLEALHQKKLRRGAHTGAVLLCPYCGVRAPALIKSKISTGGWMWFGAFFALFLYCEFTWFPIAQAPNMGTLGIFFLIVSIVGLFIIRKGFYACSHCHSRIADSQ